MLKSILVNGPPAPESLGEAHQIIQALSQLVIELATRVEQLEEERDLHSGNSSKPPSQESPKQRAQRKKKPPTGRSQGAQPGHPKHQRGVLSEDQVDRIQRYYPDRRCPCGGEVQFEPDGYSHKLM